MTGVTELFVAATILTGMLALISIWAPRRLLVKGLALSMAVLFIPVAYASFVNLLSRPKPVSLEWWLAEAREATVLGSSLREDDGIYLWLQLPDVSEPRSYVLPWDREIAEQLQKAEREAAETQGGLKMRMPFEPSLDDREPKFYALPQPAPPQKEEPAPGPQLYQAPGGRDA
jgi:hypothetical protein